MHQHHLRLALATATAAAQADFNGDRIGDVAFSASGAQSFTQSTAGVPGEDEKNDALGADVKLDDGNGSVLYLPSNGTKITASGSRAVSPSASGVSTTGNPAFGANFAD